MTVGSYTSPSDTPPASASVPDASVPDASVPNAPLPVLPSASGHSSAQNAWSSDNVAPPFLQDHIRACGKRQTTASVVGLLVTPVILIGGLFILAESDRVYIKLLIIWILVVVGVPIWGVWNLVRSSKWKRNPLSHPATRWAEVGTPEQVCQHIDRDMADTQRHLRIGPVLFTPHWMLKYDKWNVQSVPLSALVWTYPKVTTNKSYGVTTGKTYAVQAYSSDGKLLSIEGTTEEQMQQIVHQVAQRAPWAITGFNADLEKAWKKSRAQVLETVRERRTAWEQGHAANPDANADASTAPPTPETA